MTVQPLTVLLALLAALNVALLVMQVGQVYALGDVLRRLGPDQGPLVPSDGLAIGQTAPPFSGVDARTKEIIHLDSLTGGRVVLAFLSPGCGPCRRLIPGINRLAEKYRDVEILTVVAEGKGADIGGDLAQRISVMKDANGLVGKAFEVGHMPLVYLLDEERRILNRTISNNLIDLEDTLAARGHAQGTSPWVAAESNDDDEPNSSTDYEQSN